MKKVKIIAIQWVSSSSIEDKFSLSGSIEATTSIDLKDLEDEEIVSYLDNVVNSLFNEIAEFNKDYKKALDELPNSPKNDSKFREIREEVNKEISKEKICIIIVLDNYELKFFSCKFGEEKTFKEIKKKILKLI